jgi:hypothetical protein
MMDLQQRLKIKELAGIKTPSEIAREINVAPSSVREYSRKMGYPIKMGKNGRRAAVPEEYQIKQTHIQRPPAVYSNKSALDYWASVEI